MNCSPLNVRSDSNVSAGKWLRGLEPPYLLVHLILSNYHCRGPKIRHLIAICFWNRWFQCHCRIVQLCERGAEHTFLCHFHLHTICAQRLQPNATLSSVSLCTVIPIFKQYPISPTPNGGVFTPVVVLGNFQKAIPVWVFGSGINTSEALGTTS